MTEKPKSGAERQRAYHRRMRKWGFKRLAVWVPESRKEQFDEMVLDLQHEWEKAKLYPPQ